ncbi:hypothetical protein [Cytobacillus kochii]|uniref:hypothetical protein n=1 Tax=Cytobacillus kochii TaxID=859143 RepID=UPI0025A0AEAD|nr:hypothetical protein [Cytobacillus kochii]MDM5208822.1 hypothetical protein [Cytobacillus kochii]
MVGESKSKYILDLVFSSKNEDETIARQEELKKDSPFFSSDARANRVCSAIFAGSTIVVRANPCSSAIIADTTSVVRANPCSSTILAHFPLDVRGNPLYSSIRVWKNRINNTEGINF